MIAGSVYLSINYRPYAVLHTHHNFMADQAPGPSTDLGESLDIKSPQMKRRRLEQEGDHLEDWDEDLDLTQQELETLSEIEQHAIHKEGQQPSHSVPVDPEATLVLEKLPPLSAAQHRVFQAPAAYRGRQLSKSRLSTSSSSSAYPSSLSSCRRTPSTDVSSAPGSLTSDRSTCSSSLSDHSISVLHPTLSRTSASNGNLTTLSAMREELNRKKQEAEKLSIELYQKTGEVKFLRESLQRQEQELENFRAADAERREQEVAVQKENEQQLKGDTERLQTELLFKTREHAQLQEKCKSLEQQVCELQISLSSTSHAAEFENRQSSPSKLPRTLKVSSRVSEKESFPGPYASTSRVNATSPAKSAQNVDSATEKIVKEASTTYTQTTLLPERIFPMKLDVPFSEGRVTGPYLVSRLLGCGVSSATDLGDGGIIGLMQTTSTRSDLTGLYYKRDGLTARLSPVKKPEGLSTPRTPQSLTAKSIVDKNNFHLAVQGLHLLLNSNPQLSTTHGLWKENTQTSDSYLQGAELILPLIDDYLGHYIDILNSAGVAGTVTTPTTTAGQGNSTSESSLESLTSSLGILLQEGAEYANNVENLTITALVVLRKLVCYSSNVRKVCLSSRLGLSLTHQENDVSSSTTETDQEKEVKPNESGMEGDDERSSTSISFTSPESLASSSSRLHKMNFISKLLRLATPNREGSGFNQLIVQTSLEILATLAERSTGPDTDRLNVVVLRGILTDCLALNGYPAITIKTLALLRELVPLDSVLPLLCNKSDSCTLLHVHLTITRHIVPTSACEEIYLLIFDMATSCLFNIISQHRNGVAVLMCNYCQCSSQLVSCLVLGMIHLLQDFNQTSRVEVFNRLRKGVLLLHAISQQDHHYPHRHSSVHLQYVYLMTGLARIYKIMPDIPQVEVTALEELWDQEDSEVSQESEHEEEMTVE